MGETSYLAGQFLIAMPALSDPNFNRTVTFVCEHSDQGALGIIVNRPSDLLLGEILDNRFGHFFAHGSTNITSAELVARGETGHQRSGAGE